MKKKSKILALLVIIGASIVISRIDLVIRLIQAGESDLFTSLPIVSNLILLFGGSIFLLWKNKLSRWALVSGSTISFLLIAWRLAKYHSLNVLQPTLIEGFPASIALSLFLTVPSSQWQDEKKVLKKRTQILTLLVLIFSVIITWRSFHIIGENPIFYSPKTFLGLFLMVASSGLLLGSKWSWWALSCFFSLGLLFFVYHRDIGGIFWFALPLVLLLTDRPDRWNMRSEIDIETIGTATQTLGDRDINPSKLDSGGQQ